MLNSQSRVFARIVGRATLGATWVLTFACASGKDAPAATTDPIVPTNTAQVSLASPNATQASVVGTAFDYDATKSNTAFADPAAKGLTYSVAFAPASNGLSAANGRITGTPSAPGLISATITATDSKSATATNTFVIVSFASGLSVPDQTVSTFQYRDAAFPLPPHFSAQGPGGSVTSTDNTPADNMISDAGAELGRVLFYDKRLSANDQIACASCHVQTLGFADTAKLSHGFLGGLTQRHAMSLGNARYYTRGNFFWDERAASLEAQTLQPIQNATEMGMTLDNLEIKLGVTSYYPALFQAAFGTSTVTRDRISKSLAQFVRSLVPSDSRFDRAFFGSNGGPPNFAATFTSAEQLGQQLFDGTAGCIRCHETNAHVADNIHNTGLDATITDVGAGNGQFKTPSLANVGVRTPYMHDGRFATLAQVVEFYNSGVQNNPGLDNRLKNGNGPQRLNLNATQKAALVAYLNTFTDSTFLSNPRFSSPFH